MLKEIINTDENISYLVLLLLEMKLEGDKGEYHRHIQLQLLN